VLELVDVARHRLISTIHSGNPDHAFQSPQFTTDGRFLAAIRVHVHGLGKPRGADLYVWRLPSLRPVAVPHRVSTGNARVVGDSGGSIVVGGGGTVSLWDPRTVRELRSFPLTGGVTGLSPDGRTLLVEAGKLELVDLRTGRQTADIRPPATGFGNPVFAADGRSLLGINRAHNTVLRVSLASRRVRVVGREPELVGVLGDPRGNGVFATTLKKTAVLWQAGHMALGHSVRYTAPGTGSLWLVVGPGDLAATSTSPQSVRLWDLHTMRPSGPPLATGAGWAAFSPDGRSLAVADEHTGRVTVFDIRTRRVVRRLTPPTPLATDTLAYSPDGRMIAEGTLVQVGRTPLFDHGHVVVWDTRTGRVVDDFHQPHDRGVSTVAFSHDGRRLISVADLGSVAVWDPLRHRLLRGWTTPDDLVIDAVFAPGDGTIAAGGIGGGEVTFWDAHTGSPEPPPIQSTGPVYPAGYIDGGRMLAVASGTGEAQLWTVRAHRLIAALPAGPGLPGVALTPDGKQLVVTSAAGILSVLPLSTSDWVAAACRIVDLPLSPGQQRAFIPHLPYRPACR
jgi:WD40 repeat protein